MIAVEEGTVELDEPVGQPGCTLRHLLAHAGGYPTNGAEPIAKPGRRRIYSNSGIELAAAAVERRTGLPFATYVAEAVLIPLGMTSTRLAGSPASGLRWSGGRSDPTARRAAAAATAVGTRCCASRHDPVPRPHRYRSGGGEVRPMPVGTGHRDSWREVATLDGHCQLPGHVRPLRRSWFDAVGGSSCRMRTRRPDRSALRRLAGCAAPRGAR